LELKFYGSEDALIEAYNKNEVDNLALISPKNIKKIKFKQRLTIEDIRMPRYFGVFFNQNQSKILSEKNIRLALSHGTNKEALADKVLESNGVVINSPVIGVVFGPDQEVKKYEYNKDLAKETLQKAGWDKTDENGILVKGEEKLSLKLTTSTWPELMDVAQQLKEQWKELGIDLRIEILPTSDLQQVIKERNYEMLLFGEILNLDPDPFSLWHSSQKRDPGLNLALYDNKAADKLLEDARQTLNPDDRAAKYSEFQKLVVEEIPALFLYSPYYLYAHSKKITGFDNRIISTPSDRLLNIEKWYVETKRVWR
ncbi:MAG: ABC transporter substrate-binding protein, partial [Candidatus Taylorbacteria bacterium]|nr:ABC transporter substrate-binding protein [Candidatus Taylorbacteria bacterium]